MTTMLAVLVAMIVFTGAIFSYKEIDASLSVGSNIPDAEFAVPNSRIRLARPAGFTYDLTRPFQIVEAEVSSFRRIASCCDAVRRVPHLAVLFVAVLSIRVANSSMAEDSLRKANARGQILFNKCGCRNCHALDGSDDTEGHWPVTGQS